MLINEDLKEVGYISKAHGIIGELKVQFHFASSLINFNKFNSIYIGIANEPVPYLLQSINLLQQNQAIIKLEDINDRSSAELLVKKSIYIYKEFIDDDLSKEDLSKLIGYTIVDKNVGTVGVITDILEAPMQILAEVMCENEAKLLPLNEATIVEIKHNSKKINTILPDNILNI